MSDERLRPGSSVRGSGSRRRVALLGNSQCFVACLIVTVFVLEAAEPPFGVKVATTLTLARSMLFRSLAADLVGLSCTVRLPAATDRSFVDV